jgi:hypothetical protein
LKKPITKRAGRVTQGVALSSSPSTEKNKKQKTNTSNTKKTKGQQRRREAALAKVV